ncbi:MAG TPA: HEAT repeat domain-containing protein [Planctomycetota bacterium]
MKKLAIFALIALGPALKQDPAALIEQLRSDDIALRERAYLDLEKLGEAAEPHLKRVAEDRDLEFARSVRRLLRTLELERGFSAGLKKASPGLARRLARGDEGEWTRVYLGFAAEPDRSARYLFPELRREDLEPLAAEALRQAQTPEEIEGVCDAVVRWGHRSAEPEAIRLLRKPHYRTRRALMEVIKRFEGPGGLVSIALRECASDPMALAAALDEYSSFLPAESIPLLIPLLRNPDRWIRSRAQDALASNQAVEAIAEARALLRHENPEIRIDALALLVRLNPGKPAEAATALLADPSPAVRKAAIKWTAELGLIPPADRLGALFQDPDESVRVYAIERLGGRREIEVADALVLSLKDHNGAARDAALDALGCREGGAPIADIEAFLGHPLAEVRRRALDCLASCKARSAAPAVARLLDDPDPSVRRDAFQTLRKFETPVGADQLVRLLALGGRTAAQAASLLADAAPDLLRPELERLFFEERVLRGDEIADLLVRTKHPDPLGFLVEGFDKEESVSRESFQAITALKTPAADEVLRGLLKSSEIDLRRAAVEWTGDRPSPAARADLLPLLDDPQSAIRAMVVNYLAGTGLGPETARIRKMTSDESPGVRAAAAAALQRHKVPDAVADYLRLLDDPSYEVAIVAARGLTAMSDRRVIPAALAWLESGQKDLRECAFQILSILHLPEDGPRVAALLDHRESRVRTWAGMVLGRGGGRDVAQRLLPLLRDPSNQYMASSLLGDLEAREVSADVISMLDDRDVYARAGAMDALRVLGAKEAAPRVRRLLSDPDLFIRRKAIVTLAVLGDRDSVPLLIALLGDPVPLIRSEAAEAIGVLGSRETVPALIRLLEDPAAMVRGSACEALAELRATQVVPDLLRLLRDPSCRERSGLIFALARLGARDVIPDLIGLLGDSNLRGGAAEALADLGAREAIPALKSPGRDPARVALALARLGDSTGLEAMLAARSAFDRWTAAAFLCDRGDRRGVPVLLSLAEETEWLPNALNAVRRPGVWKRLRERRMRATEEGSVPNLLKRLGRRAETQVRWSAGTTFDELVFRTDWVDLGWYMANPTLIDALARVFQDHRGNGRDDSGGRTAPWDYILEDDGLRILPRAEALEFWKKWWAEEQAKKK